MTNGSWADTGLYPTILGIDARSFIPIVVFLFHWSKVTLSISIIIMLLSFVMLYHHVSYEDMFRIIRRALTGRLRYRHHIKIRHHMRNY